MQELISMINFEAPTGIVKNGMGKMQMSQTRNINVDKIMQTL